MKTVTVLFILIFLSVDVHAECKDYGTFHFPLAGYSLNNITFTNVTEEELKTEIKPYITRQTGLTFNNAHLESFNVGIYGYMYDNVKLIKVQSNRLKININAFSKFRYLRSLEIHESELLSSNFKGFNLGENAYFQKLTMSRNNISSLGTICRKHLNLKIAEITNNIFKEIKTDTFSGCSKLEDLNLSNNLIDKIEPDSIHDLNAIINLDLRGNNLTKITKNSFNGLGSLRNLNLSNNGVAFLESGAFNGLHQLQRLDLSVNNLTELSVETFKETSQLRWLSLSGNSIYSIKLKAFSALNKLTYLNLSSMNLTMLESGVFNGLFHLATLDLSFNNLTEMSEGTFNETTQLSVLDLSQNAIYSIKLEAFVGLSQLTSLNLRYNNLKIITANSFIGLSSLQILDLSSFNIDALESGAFNGLFNLQKLNLTGNKLTKLLTETLNQTKNLLNLDLSNNRISKMENGSLDGLDNLENLDLNQNKLTNLHCETIRYPFKKIRNLNMSYNEINTIDVCAFKHFGKLSFLDLSHNNISNILRGTFTSLNVLQTLNLSNNQLTQIDSALVDIKSLSHVDLADNEWDCDYLTDILKALHDRSIDANPRHLLILHEENVRGIKCTNQNIKNSTKIIELDVIKLDPESNDNKLNTIIVNVIDKIEKEIGDISKNLNENTNSVKQLLNITNRFLDAFEINMNNMKRSIEMQSKMTTDVLRSIDKRLETLSKKP